MPKNATLIRRTRKANGLTREMLAVQAGVSYDTIVRIEQSGGISEPTAVRIAGVLKLNAADLMPARKRR